MKKLIMVCAAFTIAGCSEPVAEEPVNEEVAMEEITVDKTLTDSMDVAFEDGSTGTLMLYDDGTYEMGDATGTYYERDDGMTCYLGSEADAEESCWADWVTNDDGSVTSTSEDGEVVVLSEAAA